MPGVALGILWLAFDAAGERLQIPRQVLQLLPGRARKEAGIDERIALLEAEIERLKEARQAKSASRSAADAFFKKA